MAGTGTSPWLFSLTPSWPPSGLKGWTSNPHKRGLCRNRRVQTACKFSREDEGSREVDGHRSAQALVSIGFGPATSAMGRSAFPGRCGVVTIRPWPDVATTSADARFWHDLQL